MDFVIHHPSYALVWQPSSDSDRKGLENDIIQFISALLYSVTQTPDTAQARSSMKNNLPFMLTDGAV